MPPHSLAACILVCSPAVSSLVRWGFEWPPPVLGQRKGGPGGSWGEWGWLGCHTASGCRYQTPRWSGQSPPGCCGTCDEPSAYSGLEYKHQVWLLDFMNLQCSFDLDRAKDSTAYDTKRWWKKYAGTTWHDNKYIKYVKIVNRFNAETRMIKNRHVKKSLLSNDTEKFFNKPLEHQFTKKQPKHKSL